MPPRSSPRSAALAVLATAGVACGVFAFAARGLPVLPEELASAAALGFPMGPETHPLLAHAVGLVGIACLFLAVGLPVAILTRSAAVSTATVATLALHPSTFAAATHVRYAATPLPDGTPTALGACVAVGAAVGLALLGHALRNGPGRHLPLLVVGGLAALWIPHTLERTRTTLPAREARAADAATLLDAVAATPDAAVLLVPERDGHSREVATLVRGAPHRATDDPRKLLGAPAVTLVGYGPRFDEGAPSAAARARIHGTLRIGADVSLLGPAASAIPVATADDEPAFEARLGPAFADAALAFVAVATDAEGNHRLVVRGLPDAVVERRPERDGGVRIAWRPSWRDPSGAREFRWEVGDLLPRGGSLVWTITAVRGSETTAAPFRRVVAQR